MDCSLPGSPVHGIFQAIRSGHKILLKALKVEKPFALQLLKGSEQFLLSSSHFVLTASDRQERVKAKPRRPREARGVPASKPLSDPRDACGGFVVTHVTSGEKSMMGPSPGCYPTSGCYQKCSEQNRTPTMYKRKTSVGGKAPFPGSPGPQRGRQDRGPRGASPGAAGSGLAAPPAACGPLLAAAIASEAVPRAGCALRTGTNPSDRERPAS